MTNAGRIAALIEDVAELMAWAEKLGYVPKKSPVETGIVGRIRGTQFGEPERAVTEP